MTVKEIDGMPVLKWGTYALVERSNGVMVRRYMYEITAEDKPYPTWHECTHDEAMAALEGGNDVQAFSAADTWEPVCVKGGAVYWGANPNNAHSPVATKPGREWRTKK